MTEIQEISKAQTGDQEAFRRLVEAHQFKVFHLLLGMVRNDDEAQELTQVTFVKAWQGLGRFRRDSSFWTWLYKIAYRSAIDYLRRKKLREMFVGEKEWGHNNQGDPLEMVVVDDQKREILITLHELNIHQRTAIVLYYFQGLSYEAIAEVTGRKLETIRSDLHRGKAGLKKRLLLKWGEDNEKSRYG